jgi:BRO family, N-terminal domain
MQNIPTCPWWPPKEDHHQWRRRRTWGRYWGGWMERCANRGTAEGKGALPICSPGGAQEMITLSEQGLYFFLGRSDKPAALSFQKWIARDAIPPSGACTRCLPRRASRRRSGLFYGEKGTLIVAQINVEDAARGLGFTDEKNGVIYVQ